jgi:UPF0271 protein
MHRVDLNCDLGESFGVYTLGLDEEVIPHVTSVNIACGWHAGDPTVMDRTVALAKRCGAAVGAHPSFPDLMGFGRREMALSPDEAERYVLCQIGALYAFTRRHGVELVHTKAHGSLYNMAARDIRLAMALGRAVASFDPQMALVGLAGSRMAEAAGELGLRFVSEVFADRAYEDDGSLVSRSEPGAMIQNEDAAIERVTDMVKTGRVRAVSGREIAMRADTVCVHGDNPHAVAFVRAIRARLAAEGIRVCAPHDHGPSPGR